MRPIILAIILAVSFKSISQTPASTVYDPLNNTELVSIGKTMIDMEKQYKQITKRLETVGQINKIMDVMELLSSIEQSACVIKDLDYYWDLSKNKNNIETKNCFGEVNIKMAINSIKNAVAAINTAVSSNLFALNERSENIVNSFRVIQESTKELYKIKEDLRTGVESEQEKSEFITLIYGK